METNDATNDELAAAKADALDVLREHGIDNPTDETLRDYCADQIASLAHVNSRGAKSYVRIHRALLASLA